MNKKYGFKSYNSWDPLKKCLIGNVYDKGFFEVYPDAEIGDALEKVNEDTREDITNLKNVLEDAGVETVQTPSTVMTNAKVPLTDINIFMEHTKEDKDGNITDGLLTKPLIAPRDEFIVFGEKMYNCSTTPMYDLWGPWQGCEDYMHVRTETDFDHHIEPPSIMRAGKDIQVDISFHNGETKQFAEKWLPTHCPEYRINTIEMGGHSDSVICLVKPGLLISHTKISNYEETYPGWDVIYVEKPEDEYTEAYWKYRNSLPNVVSWWIKGEEDNKKLSKFISNWMNTGQVYETHFNVNCLGIDENTLVCNYYDKELADKLKKYNVELVETPMRHRHFWDCGVHCATVDLYREGEMQDYFPERTSGQNFGKIWGNNETRR